MTIISAELEKDRYTVTYLDEGIKEVTQIPIADLEAHIIKYDLNVVTRDVLSWNGHDQTTYKINPNEYLDDNLFTVIYDFLNT